MENFWASYVKTIAIDMLVLPLNFVLNKIFNNFTNKTSIILLISISFLLLVHFYYLKRQWGREHLLKIMVENNKLHPLRELIMIYSSKRENQFYYTIRDARFKYIIKKSRQEMAGWDVEYDIHLELKVSLVKKILIGILKNIKNIRDEISFYMICENGKPDDICLQINDQLIDNPIIESITTCGDSKDSSPEFAGLYICKGIHLKNINLRKIIIIDLRYTVFSQIKESERQYTFIVVPQNYGKKIEKLNMEISSSYPVNPILQCFSGTSPYFIEDPEIQFKYEKKKCNGSFPFSCSIWKPKMKSVYVAQISL